MSSVALAGSRGGAARAALTEVDGRRVAWFSLGGGKHRGAIGPVEGDVIERAVRMGLELGIPVVGEIATSGADVYEGLPSLHAWGKTAAVLSDASGAIPIILSVVGPCVSGPALLLGLADHVVMTDEAFAYVCGPTAVAEFTGVATTRTELGGSSVHHRLSGVASLLVADEEDARAAVEDLLSYLPSNYLEDPPPYPTTDPVDRPSRIAAEVVPSRPTASYDVRDVIGDVADLDSFLEIRAAHATNVVTGYARMGGGTVGIIANQPIQKAGTLDIAASQKAAGFVQSCDAFGLPLVTFVDSPGFQPGRDLEWRGMIRHGAELVHAYAVATVPRVSIVLRKAYGGAYIVMDSRGLGNDLCLSWPNAEIAVMGAPGAVQVLHGRKLIDVADDERAVRQAELEAEYMARHCTPAMAAERGYVDEIIDPVDTRKALVAGLASLRTKRADRRSTAKHTNSPL
ncbi:MAG TPA: carboxyl transferase domain-containing protein [Acidimicrobiales bacterium]|nr:carboxyl transferase domain-containing protein [Acidimicrobiales bacterium]